MSAKPAPTAIRLISQALASLLSIRRSTAKTKRPSTAPTTVSESADGGIRGKKLEAERAQKALEKARAAQQQPRVRSRETDAAESSLVIDANEAALQVQNQLDAGAQDQLKSIDSHYRSVLVHMKEITKKRPPEVLRAEYREPLQLEIC